MQKETISNELKAQYSRDLRKQLVKTILTHEKNKDEMTLAQSYKLMNQIFSYVLKECNWSMSENSQDWDNTPLEVMIETFPKLDTTQWYAEQDISVKKNIAVQIDQNS